MSDFQHLEEIAARIKANRQQLATIDEELDRVNMRIHEHPLKSDTESTFAKMIGTSYNDELEELEKSKNILATKREELSSAIKNDMNIFITEIISSNLIIPLEPNPKFNDGNTIYAYRNGAKFNNVFDILSELLGLSSPIVVKDVMLSSSEVVVKVSDEFEAKKKFINSINEVQKTLAIKVR